MNAEQREEHAKNQGRDWAGRVRRGMLDDGRRVEGGWPCTLTEARAHLGLSPTETISPDELAHLARVCYGAARETWLADRDD